MTIDKEVVIPPKNEMFVSAWDDDVECDIDEDTAKKSKESYIMWAAEHGELHTVKQLVNHDITLLTARDSDGYSPLHRASYSNHVHILEYLLSAGADFNATTDDGWTPLHSAAHWNSTLCAIRLIERGANVNATTKGGHTPLHLAAGHGASKDTLEVLLLHPLIDPMIKNQVGDTARDIAARSGVYAGLFDMCDPSVTELNIKR